MENSVFKSVAFGGFDKQDVIQYIEKAAQENAAAQETLQSENDTLRAQCAAQEQSNSQLTERLAHLEASLNEKSNEAAQLQVRLEQKTQEAAQLGDIRSRYEQLSAEAESLRPDAEAYRQFRTKIGDIECEARKRAGDLERETVSRLQVLVDQFRQKYQNLTTTFDFTSGYVTGELRKVEVNLSQLPRALDQIGANLEELDKALHPSDQA